MNRRYFGGERARNNHVHELKATTFQELVERYFDIPVVFRMTRADFLAHPDRDILKDGPYISCVSFRDGCHTRRNEHADLLNLVIIDMDEGDFVRTIFEAPEAVIDALHPWNALIYTTAKHTPENPRLKLVVDVGPCDTQYHRALVHTVLNRIGAPARFKGITESTTLTQPQYRPMQFQGEEYTAVLAKRTKGVAMSVSDIEEVTEDSEHREYAYRGEGLETSAEALAWMPRLNITVEDVKPALLAIDPDCNRQIWVNCIASLRHQFRDETQAREAFDLFEQWSSAGSKYKEGEPYKIWKSFRPDATNRRPITIGTLFKHAMDAGWEHRHVAEKIQKSVEDWIMECDDKTVLLEQGCAKIVSMPFRTDTMEDFLMELLRKKFKDLSGVALDKRAVKKQLSQEKFEKKRIANSGEEVPAWLGPFCYISTQNVFHNISTGTQLIPDAFNNCYSVHLMPKDDDGEEEANNGRPQVLPVHFALNQMRIRRVDKTLYWPLEGGNDPFVKVEGQWVLNTYMPSSLPIEDATNSALAGKLFREHVAILIPEKEYQELFLDFLSFCVQFPGRKIPWAFLFQSAEGIGKGFLGKILARVMGRPNVRNVTPETLKDKWTDWMFDSCLNILDEIHLPGEHRERVTNNLKKAITDETLPMMKKYENFSELRNLTNYIGFTNYLDALHLKPSDRRWCIISSILQTKDQVEELNESGHFWRMEPLLHELTGGLRHWLMNRKIGSDFPVNGPPPKTKYWFAVVEESKNPLLLKIEDLTKTGNPLIAEDVIHYEELNRITAHEQRNNRKLTTYLRMLGYESFNASERYEIGGVRTTVWVNSRKFDGDILDPAETLTARFEASDKSL